MNVTTRFGVSLSRPRLPYTAVNNSRITPHHYIVLLLPSLLMQPIQTTDW